MSKRNERKSKKIVLQKDKKTSEIHDMPQGYILLLDTLGNSLKGTNLEYRIIGWGKYTVDDIQSLLFERRHKLL